MCVCVRACVCVCERDRKKTSACATRPVKREFSYHIWCCNKYHVAVLIMIMVIILKVYLYSAESRLTGPFSADTLPQAPARTSKLCTISSTNLDVLRLGLKESRKVSFGDVRIVKHTVVLFYCANLRSVWLHV